MAGRQVLIALTAFAATAFSAPQVAWSAPRNQISFEQRVEAQRAIERVYFSHLTGSRRTFEQAVTQDLLGRKVHDSLQRSAVLNDYWITPISGAMLRAEWQRIERSTRFPERLVEIQNALGGDAILLQETLVRSALAERLTRSFFATDTRIHAAARAEAEEILSRLQDGRLSPDADHPRRTVVDAAEGTSNPDERHLSLPMALEAVGGARTLRVEATPQELDGLAALLPAQIGEPGPVEEEPGAFTIKVRLAADPGVTRLATYRVPKISWDAWWAAHRAEFDESAVPAVAESIDLVSGSAPAARLCQQDNTWDAGALGELPEPRSGHQAVWTGTEMIIWGFAENASRYDPLTDTWRGVSTVGAPPQPNWGTAVWTGMEMLVWGFGGLVNSPAATGGRYDPASDSWSPISSADQPEARRFHSAVWTGREMIVWGGFALPLVRELASGGRYDPATDRWLPLSELNAPSPRHDHTAVWTGTEMIVWGGQEALSTNQGLLSTGGRYNPATDTWTEVSNLALLWPRSGHSAVWTGSEMLIWGGAVNNSPSPFEDTTAQGAAYNPATDGWRWITGINVPEHRSRHTAVWTGHRMIIWGGLYSRFNRFQLQSGAAYDPAQNAWQSISETDAPAGVSDHTAVWTGSIMITWGGGYNTRSAAGGRYDPQTDSWTPTSHSLGGVTPSGSGPALWTGTEMLTWSVGAQGIGSGAIGGGARYDPMLDTWHAISEAGAPTARMGHAAVWTGDEMVVWAGHDLDVYLRSGGRYDLQSDTWRPVSEFSPAQSTEGASAIWTGQEMIVWGGTRLCYALDCFPYVPRDVGARYNPATDSWRTMAPLWPQEPYRAMVDNAVVWTGHEMIVWGGCPVQYGADYCYSTKLGTGARYDPARDAWTPIPTLLAQARTGHAAVWTGRQMYVVGGTGVYYPYFPAPSFYQVIAYDAAADSWSFVDVDPNASYAIGSGGSAVWTGRQLISWGGSNFNNQGGSIPFGAIYDITTGTWGTTPIEGAPLGRLDASAIWTGSFVLIWGGFSNGPGPIVSGSRYVFGQDADDDGDGLSECAGDCDDTDEAVNPGGAEICNGLDDNCDGEVDEDSAGLDTDADGTPNTCDSCPTFANPGQSDPLICSSVDQGGGQCLQAQVVLPEPIDQGAVTVLTHRGEAPAAITLELSVSSCLQIDPIQILLNGHLLATFTEPTDTCTCVAPVYRVEVADATLLQSFWLAGAPNVFEIHKPGQAPPPGVFFGSYVGWIRARIETDDPQEVESVCLFDFGGGECTELDQCVGSATSDALDETVTVPVQFHDDNVFVTQEFASSNLPARIDLRSVPDGPAMVCIGPAGPPQLYAVEESGALHVVDTATGAASDAGALPFGLRGLAHDEVSRQSFAETTGPVGQSIDEIDLVGLKSIGTSSVLTLPLAGMEMVGGTLYGIESQNPGARLIEMNPASGASRPLLTLADGSWHGLAYDPALAVFYAARADQGSSSLWAVDPFGRTAQELHALSVDPSALEIGPDAFLYASVASGANSMLYRIDPATGGAAVVGPMGISGVVGLMTVRNQPRGCFGIVKQGEQSLEINGTCNAPPDALAGVDFLAECTTHAGADVVLDGSASLDPDAGGSLYEWFEGFGTTAQSLLGSGKVLSVTLPVGHHVITLKVTTSVGGSDTDGIIVDVGDSQPPRATARLEPVGIPGPGQAGQYIARVGAIDACAATPEIHAWLIGEGCEPEAAFDGLLVEFVPAPQGCLAAHVNGALVFHARSLTLRVFAGDGTEHLASAQTRLEGFGPDADGDGASDVVDCNPADATAWATPGEARDVTMADGGLVISWGVPSQPGGAAVTYDVIASKIASGFDGAGSCLETGTEHLGASDATVPVAGGARFYLVRARNVCPGAAGSGVVGLTSSGSVRPARACP